MKIIGISESGEYICTVDHSELEKYLGLYYGNLRRDDVKPGTTINLGKGHDYAREIKEAMSATQELIKKNQNVVNAIMNGMRVVGNMEGE